VSGFPQGDRGPGAEPTALAEPEAAPLPAGARDVLPAEAGELRALDHTLRTAFAGFGYREVMTPVLEFAAVMDRAQEGGLGHVFRLFDESGRVLVLRPDSTIPVSRLVAGRLADHPGPVRVSYVARAFRPPPPGRPQAAEQRQAGVELVGSAGPAADAEVIGLLRASLAAAGLVDFRIGLGDVSLTAAVLDGLEVGEAARGRLRAAAGMRNLVAWRRAAESLDLPDEGGRLLAALPTLRGGAEVLDRVEEAVPAAGAACARLRRTLDLLEAHGAREAVLVDLGVLRDWPYYSGVVFEAYAARVGVPVAVGGRYDGLGARFGRDRPAVGFAITLEPLHRALAGQEDAPAAPRAGLVLVGGMDEEIGAARDLRAIGVPVIALEAGDASAETLAESDGWRYVARREGEVYRVLDRLSGDRSEGRRLLEMVT